MGKSGNLFVIGNNFCNSLSFSNFKVDFEDDRIEMTLALDHLLE